MCSEDQDEAEKRRALVAPSLRKDLQRTFAREMENHHQNEFKRADNDA